MLGMTNNIDTLKVANRLMESGLNRGVAEELAAQFKYNEEIFLEKKEAEEKLATKLDIAEVKLEIEKNRTETSKALTKQTIWLSTLTVSCLVAVLTT